MQKMSFQDVQRTTLEILRYIKQICDKNGIEFFLAYGTALGAVRHHGFIPWDDDIDIYMKREDYIAFSKAMHSEISPYCLLDTSTKNYSLPLPKVIDTRTVLHQTNQREFYELGVYVDVFILDKIPEDDQLKNKYFKKLNRYQCLWHFFQYKREDDSKSLGHLVKKVIYNSFHPRIFASKINHYAQKYSDLSSRLLGEMCYVGNVALRNKEVFPNSFFDSVEYAEFEDDFYPVPSPVDEYLKHCYGNWQELPPSEKRVSNHTMEAFYKD